jgi:chromosome segregation ATPase
MDGKIFLYLILLGAAVGGSYKLYLDQDLGELNTRLAVVRQEMTGVQSQIDRISSQLQRRSSVIDLTKTIAALKEEKARLETEILAVEAERPALTEGIRAAIAQIRQQTVGMRFDELTLTTGAPLKNALIQEVSDDELVIKHSLGIRRARVNEWTADLKERLRPGALADTKPVVAAAASAPDPVIRDGVMSEARQKHGKKILDAQLATEKLRRDLASLEELLRQAENELNSNPSASRKYYIEVRRNQYAGQVAAQKSRVSAAQDALRRLEAEPPPP